jgi:hypothetical protein
MRLLGNLMAMLLTIGIVLPMTDLLRHRRLLAAGWA